MSLCAIGSVLDCVLRSVVESIMILERLVESV